MNIVEAIEIAIEKGYTYDPEGYIIGLKNTKLSIRRGPNQNYPTFSVNVGNKVPCGVFGIQAHKFAAWFLFGEVAFQKGIHVRHLNSDKDDFSAKNLAIGTPSQNEMDKPFETRSRVGRIARSFQPKEAHNRKLSKEILKDILSDYKAAKADAEECGLSKLKRGLLDDLAKKYKVSRGTMYNVITKKYYKEVWRELDDERN